MALDPQIQALMGGSSPAQPTSPQAAPATGPADEGGGLDPQLQALAASVQKDTPAAAPTGTMSWPKFIGNEAVRVGAQAINGLPGLAEDIGVTARNASESLAQKLGIAPAIYGVNRKIEAAMPKALQSLTGSILPTGPGAAYTMPTQQFGQALDSLTTAPTSGLGKLAEFTGSAVLGSKLPTPTVGNTPAAFVSPLAKPASALTGAQQQALDQGTQLGMRATPGQQVGSKALQQLEAKLESQPWTSGPFNAIASANSRVLGTQAAKAIGEDSPIVDSTVLGRASDRLANLFQSVRSASRSVQQAPEVTDSTIKGIDSDFSGLLPGNMSIASHPLVAQLKDLADTGSINGEQLGQLSSKLGKSAYKQMSSASGDRDLGQALYRVKDYVDDLVQSTLSGDEASAYSAGRTQYRNLMTLLKPGVVNPSTGEVSGRALANALGRTDRSGFTLGRNTSPLYAAARFSQAFKPVVGDSGTATRSGMGLLPLIGTALGGLGGHFAGLGGMEGAGAGAAAGAAAAPLLNLGSRAYLRMAAPLVNGARATPGALRPLAKPLLYGGLLSAE